MGFTVGNVSAGRAVLLGAVAVLIVALAATAPGAPVSAGKPPAAAAAVQVAEPGYAASARKIALLMSKADAQGAPFAVVGANGQTVLQGHAGPSRGVWDGRYAAVHPLDLTAVHTPGTYLVEVSVPGGAVRSAAFRVARAGVPGLALPH